MTETELRIADLELRIGDLELALISRKNLGIFDRTTHTYMDSKDRLTEELQCLKQSLLVQ
jgi:hypothetical protein